MSDLAQRVEAFIKHPPDTQAGAMFGAERLLIEQAERIEKLEAENKELRGDLNIATLRLKAALGQKRGDFDINDPGH